jgi:Uma2 family endonuclease
VVVVLDVSVLHRVWTHVAVRLVVEVASASTELRDAGSKKALYEAHGIPTYLLVDPAAGTLVAWELEGGAYRTAWRTTDEGPGHGLPAGVTLADLTREPR